MKLFSSDPSFEDVKFSSVYIGPEVGESGSVPLIVWPHGGPHSVFLTSHDRDVEFFNNLGFAVLMVTTNNQHFEAFARANPKSAKRQ